MAAIHVSVTLGLRHQSRADYANLSLTAQMAIVHGFDGPTYNLHLEQRDRLAR
jgi:hypothetical protein